MTRAAVLVTGGAGYIGSHTAKALAGAGFLPVVLDTLALGHKWAVKWGPLVQGDISDESLVRHLLAEYRIEAVIHFAGSAYVGESMTDPRKYLHDNVSKGLRLLNASIDSQVKQFIFSSTCATYGSPEYLPIDEKHPQLPINPYGDSKLFIEKTLGWYARAHALRFVSLRYFNAAGADPAGELGESHSPETHLIPLAIQTALGRRKHITIFGTDFPTSDGTAIRDYVHVTDLAAAHLRALQYLAEGGENGAYNLGVGAGHSVRQVIGCVEKLVGERVRTVNAPRRQGDPAVLVAAADKARKELGWAPAFLSLEQIIETAVQWELSSECNSLRAEQNAKARIAAESSRQVAAVRPQ